MIIKVGKVTEDNIEFLVDEEAMEVIKSMAISELGENLSEEDLDSFTSKFLNDLILKAAAKKETDEKLED